MCIESRVSVRGVGKFALLLAVLAALAAGLAACGSDDSGSTTGASSTATAPSASSDSGSSKGDDKGTAPGKGGEDGGGSDDAPSSDDGASSGDAPSSKGQGSAAFHTKGGDNSIQDYGEEADGSELDAAEAALTAYFDARAQDDWDEQCEDLAETAVKPLEQLAAGSAQLKGKGCPALVEALTAGVPAASRANPMTSGLASLRREDERGFALFHGPKGVDYFIPMVEEDGEWKVAALAASEFP